MHHNEYGVIDEEYGKKWHRIKFNKIDTLMLDLYL